MPRPAPLIFTPLHESPLVRVQDYVCRAAPGGPGPEEQNPGNTIVLLRQGVFRKHLGRRAVTADVNQTVFFTKGSTVRVSHPSDCGDRGTVFTLRPDVLKEIVCDIDPSREEHPDRPFPFVTGHCDDAAFWRHRELVRRIAAQEVEPLEPLWVEVAVLRLSAGILRAAFAGTGSTSGPRRPLTGEEHANTTEGAKSYLASSVGLRVTLDDVAKAVHTSPFHLARLFRRCAGVPVHRYLMQLRLRASLERLEGGEDDLTALALELGFSSHSHFAVAFRAEFGKSPSEVRAMANRRTLKRMRDSLQHPRPTDQ